MSLPRPYFSRIHEGYSANENDHWMRCYSRIRPPSWPSQRPATKEGYGYSRSFQHATVQLDIQKRTAKHPVTLVRVGARCFSTEMIEHINRKGDNYYLHEGLRKDGKKHYYFSKKPVGGIDFIPNGYSIYEKPASGMV